MDGQIVHPVGAPGDRQRLKGEGNAVGSFLLQPVKGCGSMEISVSQPPKVSPADLVCGICP